MDDRSPARARSLALGLFFLSGATGLSLEVLWVKRFGQLFGSTSLALGAVVGTYLAGLGLGALLVTRWLPRARRPLAWYGAAELFLGVVAMGIPFLLGPLSDLAAPWLSPGRGAVAVFSGRLAVTAAALLLPTVLMGATLPCLVRHLEAGGESLGRAAAGAYAANSLGAATGALASGFFLLPLLGFLGTTFAVAGTNLLVGIAALLRAREVTEAQPRPREAATKLPLVELLIASLTGFGALLLQMVWGRQLVLILGGSTYSWTCLLAVFVGGLGLGGALYRARAARLRSGGGELHRGLGNVLVVLVVLVLLASYLLGPLGHALGSLRLHRASLLGNALLSLGASAILMGPATVAMGYLLPALFERTRLVTRDSERAVGLVLATNTVGSVAAALLGSSLLVPLIGTRGTLALALVGYLLAAFLSVEGRERRRFAAPAVGLALLLAWALPGPPDPRHTNLGLYLYGPAAYPDPLATTEVVSFAEGPGANVLVLEEGPPGERVRTLRINGKIDGGTGAIDRVTQEGLGLLPRLLRPSAREVLVIGYGTGTTAGVSLLFPGTSVDCVELEPEVLAAGVHFRGVNHAPETSPDFRAIHEDGRSYLRHAGQSYDLIVSEPTNPWISGVGNLYTQEFFETARGALGRTGLLAQWVQLYSLSNAEFALVLRTLRKVFPHVLVLYSGPNDAILVASLSPVLPDRAGLAAAQELLDSNPEAGSLYEERFGTRTVEAVLLPRLLLGTRGVDRLAAADGRADVITDANMRLEFDAPRRLFDPAASADSVRLEVDLTLHQRVVPDWGWGAATREGLRGGIDLYRSLGAEGVASSWLALACQFFPDAPDFLAERLLRHGPAPGRTFDQELLHLARRDGARAVELLRTLAERGDPAVSDLARTLARRLPDLAPELEGLGGGGR